MEGTIRTKTTTTMTTTATMTTDTTNPDASFRPFPFGELLAWHDKNDRAHLPWRDFSGRDPHELGYRVWMSEIFLQQTQAERVIGYYSRILAKYPTVGELARANYEEFFEYYRGLGYYSRARNMLAAARIVDREYGGEFPRDTTALRALPGVGPYTAEAVRAFAHDLPTLAVDTNLERVFGRYYAGSRYARLPKSAIESLVAQMAREGRSGRSVNAALMDLGAATANKSSIDYANYPLPGCRFAETLGALEAESAKSRTIFPLADATRIVVLHADHRRYFSSEANTYSPFVLPPLPGDFRSGVQAYFE
jgi:A/G-specific adenine glycosylase